MHRCRALATLGAMASAMVTLAGCIPITVPFGSGNRDTVKGSGISVEEVRDLAPFDQIEVGAAIHAQVTVGKEQAVTVSADDNIGPLLQTTVSNRRLTVGYAPDTSIEPASPVRVESAVPGLRFVGASGAATVEVVGLAARDLEVEASGASNMTLAGGADALDVTASGASRLLASDLLARSARIEASGASRVDVDVTGSLSVSASGASSVCYRRDPDSLDQKTSGASSVDRCRSEKPW